MSTNPTKYFLYARKSSEAEDKQAASIEQQIDELKKVAFERNLEIAGILTEAQSAKKPGRKVFNQMLSRIYRQQATGILCWKLDRLARNPIDGGQIIWLLQQGTIQHIQTYERSYYPNDNVLMIQVEFGMANQYIRDLSTNVKRGLAKKVRDGWRPGVAPMGYVNSFDKQTGSNVITPDPLRFPLVKRLWDLVLRDNCPIPQLWRIAKYELKLITTPRKNLGGRALSRSAIYSLLKNPFYYGWFEFPRDSGQWYKGQHEPMITESEFNEVQYLITYKDKPKPKRHDFAFTGLMKCGTCGCSITAETKTKYSQNGNVHRYIYYHCTKKKLDVLCDEPFIEIKDLHLQFKEKISEITISEDIRDWAVKFLHEIRKTEAKSSEIGLDLKRRELTEIEQQLRSLTLNFTSPANQKREILSEKEYQSLKTDLLKQKDRLEQDLKVKGEELEKWVELSKKAFDFACYASIWFEKGDTETKKAILACLGSNLVISGKKLSISLHSYVEPFMKYKNGEQVENVVVRTDKFLINKRKNRVVAPVSPTWLGLLNDVRTFFLNCSDTSDIERRFIHLERVMNKEPYSYIPNYHDSSCMPVSV